MALTAGYLLALSPGTASSDAIEPLERILETARQFAAESTSDIPGGETRIEVGTLDNRLRLARCAHPPTARLAPGGRLEGNTTVNVRCTEPVSWSLFVPVRIQRYTQVVVAARALSRGHLILPSDVRLARMETARASRGYQDTISAVLGHETRRAIAAGQAVTGTDIQEPLLVHRGDRVTLYASRPGLTVRVKGVALEDGRFGERVRVRNERSERVVDALVEASGRLRIDH